MDFDWDADKAAANIRRHRVTFEEASTAFSDPHRLIAYDVPHATYEDRWLLIGISNRWRLLSVAYTRRDEKIRIISARRANQAEEGRYSDQA